MDRAFNTIHRTDCIRGLAQLQPGTIDLAFADPPFNIGYDYDVYDDKRDADSYLGWTKQWMEGVYHALKPTGTFWLAIGDEYAAEMKVIATRELGLTCRSWVIWYYTFGVNCTKKFSRSHAHLFHFVKDPKNFTFNAKDIKVPSARQLVYGDGRAHPNGRLPDDTWILRPQDVPDGFTPDQDTWYFPRVAGTFKERAGFHGCQMPEQLLGRIIRLCSNPGDGSKPGDVVLDPFAGSGTTLAVANKLGRRWVGFELSEKYAKNAMKRIEGTTVGQPLEGAAEPTVSAPKTPQNGTEGNSERPSRLVRARGQRTPKDETERAIIAAFLVAGAGFSTDRVVADPLMNCEFLDQCTKLGVPGDAKSWNLALLKIRKAAKLSALPPAKRTTFSAEELDSYIFASEIAIRRMLESGCESLDDILCDPKYAREFDRIAEAFAPGFSPLQYRWAALTIRKRAHDIRTKRNDIPHEVLQRVPRKFQPLNQFPVEDLESVEGVYLFRSEPDCHLYAGESANLGARLRRNLSAFDPWAEICPNIEIGIIKVSEYRQGLQSTLIKNRQPTLNFLQLGVG